MTPLRGIVTGTEIKMENGVTIEWVAPELKPGNKVLIFYDFTRGKIRKIIKDVPIENELKNIYT